MNTPNKDETTALASQNCEVNYMGVDQWGNTYHNLGKHPRKALVERTGHKHVSKMYVDGKEGETPWAHCIGYVVGPFWVTLYEVKPATIE